MYRRYLLAVLLVILTSNNMDGLILGLLSQDIKVDLRLSDTQLGLLSGMAFALFYSVMGIPIARWADRGNRVIIISVTQALWSVMLASCGLAANFVQLLLIRVGVAVGEAGCVPPAHSLIADHFERAERPRAVGIYMLGGSLSIIIGYFTAGWLNELYGWRITFATVGMFGLIPAALAWLTLKDPRRAQSVRVTAPTAVSKPELVAVPTAAPSLGHVFRTLWRNMTFRHLVYCFSVFYFFGYGLAQWEPAFFIRSYSLTTGRLGMLMALVHGSSSLIGTYLGGALAARYATQNETLQLKSMAVAFSGFAALTALAFLARGLLLSFGLIWLAGLGVSTTTGPLFATIQTIVPERMRAMSIAIVYFLANLIGMGLGPLAAGTLSDALQPYVGGESLRYALLILCPGYLFAAYHLWKASSTVAHDVSYAQ